MPFHIDATDRSDGAEIRASVRPAHMEFLDRNLPRLIAAGAKLRDDGTTAWGSIYIIDTDDRAEAEAFIGADPFSAAGLFGEVAITRWRKGFFNFERLAPRT